MFKFNNIYLLISDFYIGTKQKLNEISKKEWKTTSSRGLL